MSIEKKIRKFVLTNYLFTEDDTALLNDSSFMENGILDSTGILELIMFLHDEFEVDVHDDEMIPQNLDSVNAVVAFVELKTASQSA
jgi:acyl carrier protein